MKHLIIGSGGMISVKFVGVLKYLKDQGHLNDLSEISGSSSGALLAAFYILLKGDLDSLIKLMTSIDVREYTKINIKNFIYNFGLIDINNLKKLIEDNGFKDITFRELYEICPIKLFVPTFDMSNQRTVYMSIDTHPDMDVSDALSRTMAVPFLFTPVEGVYLDGSISESNPGTPFIGKTDVFEIRTNDAYSQKRIENTKSLYDYFVNVLYCFLLNRVKIQDFKRIEVPIDFDIFDFSMTTEKKYDLYLSGYQLAVLQIPRLLGNPKTDHLTHCIDDQEQTEDSQCPPEQCDPVS